MWAFIRIIWLRQTLAGTPIDMFIWGKKCQITFKFRVNSKNVKLPLNFPVNSVSSTAMKVTDVR